MQPPFDLSGTHKTPAPAMPFHNNGQTTGPGFLHILRQELLPQAPPRRRPQVPTDRGIRGISSNGYSSYRDVSMVSQLADLLPRRVLPILLQGYAFRATMVDHVWGACATDTAVCFCSSFLDSTRVLYPHSSPSGTKRTKRSSNHKRWTHTGHNNRGPPRGSCRGNEGLCECSRELPGR